MDDRVYAPDERARYTLEFDPDGTDAIPRLFDEFDRLAAATAGQEVRGELPAGFEHVFRYSLLRPDADVATEAAAYRPAFAHLALLAQIPGVDVGERVAAEKGGPLSEREATIRAERVVAAERWLEAYAPERARVAVRERLPDEATALGEDQRLFLGALALAAEAPQARSGEAWQALIFATAARATMPAGRAFGALYLAFLGRTNGPRAGWLLASLDPGFVIARLRAAAGWDTGAATNAEPGGGA